MADGTPQSRRLSPNQTRALLLCLDGMRYSAGICIGCHARALEQLHGFERYKDFTVPTDAAMFVLADIWSMVDAAHRLRTLLERAPVLPKKDPAARIFLDSTAKVEDLRHYVQHLDGEIGRLEEGSPPLWGTITWVKSDDPQTYLQLMTGNINLRPSYQGPAYDNFEHRFVRRFELHAGTTNIDLDDLLQRVKVFDAVLREWSARIVFGDGSKYEYSPPRSPLVHVTARPIPRVRAPEESS